MVVITLDQQAMDSSSSLHDAMVACEQDPVLLLCIPEEVMGWEMRVIHYINAQDAQPFCELP